MGAASAGKQKGQRPRGSWAAPGLGAPGLTGLDAL